MPELVADYSFSRPSPAALKALGIAGVMRYLSRTSSKGLTAGEAAALLGNRLWIGLTWESSPDRSITGGNSGGQSDALDANEDADNVGAPKDAAIFYATDTFARVEQVRAYYQGVRSRSQRPVGFYGGLYVGLALLAEGIVEYVWVANAYSWSGAHSDAALHAAAFSSPAHLLQRRDHPFASLPANAYDINEVIHAFPAWGRPLAPPAPKVKPDMHVVITSPIVSYLSSSKGAWALLESGAVITLSGGFYGTPFGKPYWKGRKAAQLRANPNLIARIKHPYVVIDSQGEVYGRNGF